jgi:hypothetical protein
LDPYFQWIGEVVLANSDHPEKGSRYPVELLVGLITSGLWIAALVAIYVRTGWPEPWRLKPNEFGDFLAGTFAPLAFLWLVLAVFLQKRELQLQREELMQSTEALILQASETRALLEESKQSVNVARAALEGQQKDKLEDRLNSQLDLVAQRIILVSDGCAATYHNVQYYVFGRRSGLEEAESKGGADRVLAMSLEKSIVFNGVIQEYPDAEVVKPTIVIQFLQDVVVALNRIIEAAHEAGAEVVMTRVEALGLRAIILSLEQTIRWLQTKTLN